MPVDARVALVTCAAFPDLWEDDHPVRDALRARGVAVDVVRWDDPDADWSTYDLTVIRSPWDYVPRRDEFVAWARGVPRLANPADIIAWNTDKRYLSELAAGGVPVIPTTFVAPGETWPAPAEGEWVVKPTVSAGSQDTARYVLPAQLPQAEAHIARLTGGGRTAMIQPYLPAVDTAGETAVLCLPDTTGELTFSHAIRKGPMLRRTGEHKIDPGSEDITPREPSPAELSVAAKALAAVPGGAKRLLYARVDMIPGPDGTPLMVEFELAEPSLFLSYAPGSGDRLADAVLTRL
ncbi:ATP-grasp domain-containing protein [Actinoplanes sp. HUAS TT8]|uniref:ATP-grasp domain-containing protein n=1 Tax=Actinoplanes sp. HUAS TT8 TaxID=3447453 RepID=UPI003F521C3D